MGGRGHRGRYSGAVRAVLVVAGAHATALRQALPRGAARLLTFSVATAREQDVARDPLLRLAAGGIFSAMLQVALQLDAFATISDRRVPVSDLGRVWRMPAYSARVPPPTDPA